MKQRLFIILALIVLTITLVGLNAVSYTQTDTLPDSEEFPNRSTFNTGSTGTRAFYELLTETGRRVTRWQENPASLLGARNKPQTFVMIGALRRDITDTEAEQILQWVSEGGRLVIIDRAPVPSLLKTSANWSISSVAAKDVMFGVDPSDPQQMTSRTNAAKPVQPTVFTGGINAVQPSRFASSVKLNFFGDAASANEEIIKDVTVEPPIARLQGRAGPVKEKSPPPPEFDEDEPPPPMVKPSSESPESPTIQAAPDKTATAPFVHLANDQKTILVDFPYGAGQIVFLTDPYIVSNAGVNLVDNAQLAINVIAGRDGLIAFDEYHHGYGGAENRLLGYFAGTPVLWIFGQVILLILLLLWSQSRRFARPLPMDEPDRLSKLEYVAAFAELQQRTKAYDLALENIYSEFRRSLTRAFGMDNYTTSRKELARMIAERGKFNELEIYNTMKRCEEIIHGEPTGKREILRLTARLREIEAALGIKRHARNR